jgi:hypothetical protein
MSNIEKIKINNGNIDWTNFIDVFIITNGRQSFPYSLKSIQNQKGIKFNLIIIKNMKWLDACNTCMNYSDNNYFFRVDDDMLLNQYTFLFFNYLINKNKSKDVVMFHVKLWEPHNNRLANKVKVYDRELTKSIGFEIDERGKVDKIFNQKRKEKEYKYSGDKKSFVGIHAACSSKDNTKYTKLFGWKDGKDLKIRQKEIIKLDNDLKKYPLSKQLEMSEIDLINSNKKVNSNFYKFVQQQKGNIK